MNKDSKWIGKNVFITGINGFIGGNLAKKLVERGANVFGLVRNAKRDSFIYFEELDKKINLINGELTDFHLLSRIIAEEQIDVVFHLAAQVEVGVGINNPFLTYETNIKGTYSLLEAVRLFGKTVKSIVVASTDKSYGDYPADMMPYQEDYPLKPKYPYDVSKACADMISQSYANDIYKLPIVVTRFCNIFGPGQLNFSAVIPDAIRSALGYSTFIPRSDGRHIRDFIFVEDVTELYLNIARSLEENPQKYMGEIFNAGTNKPIDVRTIIEKVFKNVGNETDLKIVVSMMEGKTTTGEISCQYMDFKKVNQFFGWEPRHSFDQGLKLTIEWFKKYLKLKYSN